MSLTGSAFVVCLTIPQDAIGAIGVARCFTYGGHIKRALYDTHEPPTDTSVTQEQYMQQTSASIDIFYQVSASAIGFPYHT